MRRHLTSTLFPYTTLFRSGFGSRQFRSWGRRRLVGLGGRGFGGGSGRRNLDLRAQRACVFRSEEHTSELQSHSDLVCRLLLEKKKHRERVGTSFNTRQWPV